MGLVQIGGEIRAKPLNDNFAYLDGKLLFGPESNRPNPGISNRLYVTIDTGIVYADTGTDWIQVGGLSEIDWGSIVGKPSTFPPSAHASQHRSGGSDPITPADIGAASQVDFDAHLAESAKKHIHESGVNANGRYIRFDDGTQICVRESLLLQYSTPDVIVGTWYYPASFIAVPAVFFNSKSALSKSKSSTYQYFANTSPTVTQPVVRSNDLFTSGDEINVGLFALGRWK